LIQRPVSEGIHEPSPVDQQLDCRHER
jgi:hypothetical protein